MIRTLRTIVPGSASSDVADLEVLAREAIVRALDYRKAVAVGDLAYVGVHQPPIALPDGTKYWGPDDVTMHAFEVQVETAS